MNSNKNKFLKRLSRPILLMQVGPLHLFWTSAVFYLWVLKEKYNIVLIAPETYKKDKNFQKIKSLSSIVQVEYFSYLGFIKKFDSIIKSIDNILISFKPAVALIYNTCHLENQLLLKKLLYADSSIPIYQYQNGQQLINTSKDYWSRDQISLSKILDIKMKLLFFFPSFLKLFLKIKSQLAYFYYFKMISFFKINFTLTPPQNPFSGKINSKAISLIYGHQVKGYFVYTEVEAEYFRKQGINNVIIVNHPMKICCEEVFHYLGLDLQERDQILIVPSHDYSAFLRLKGWNDNKIIRFLSSHWISVFDNLLNKFPNFSIKMKFHPSVDKDFIYEEIKDILIKSNYDLNFLDSSESAELSVVQSRIIVGDVSSVLWWAAIYGGKTVISLDVFNFFRDNQMSLYDLPIHYVSNLDYISSLSTSVPKNKNLGNFLDYVTRDIKPNVI